MFDIGFWELALIGVVALVVIGPERLPRVARTAGLWFGRARRFVGTVKADIEKEIRAEELKRIMEEQARSTGLHDIVEETRSTFDGARSGLESLDAGLDDLTIDRPAESAKAPTQSPAAERPAPPPAVAPTQKQPPAPSQSESPK